MHINESDLLRNFARVRRAALAGETVVIATRDGNLALAAQPPVGDPLRGPRPGEGRRFVSRAVIADAARGAPRIDAEQFRADLDAHIAPHV